MVEDYVSRARQSIAEVEQRERQRVREEPQRQELEQRLKREEQRLERERLEQERQRLQQEEELERERERVFRESVAKTWPAPKEVLQELRDQYRAVTNVIRDSGLWPAYYNLTVSTLIEPQREGGIIHSGRFSVRIKIPITGEREDQVYIQSDYDPENSHSWEVQTRPVLMGHRKTCLSGLNSYIYTFKFDITKPDQVTVSVRYKQKTKEIKHFRHERPAFYSPNRESYEGTDETEWEYRERYAVPLTVLPTDPESVDQLVNALLEDTKLVEDKGLPSPDVKFRLSYQKGYKRGRFPFPGSEIREGIFGAPEPEIEDTRQRRIMEDVLNGMETVANQTSRLFDKAYDAYDNFVWGSTPGMFIGCAVNLAIFTGICVGFGYYVYTMFNR